MPGNLMSDSTETTVSPYRCLAYKDEEGAEVTDTIIVATDPQRARDLFVLELGAEKIKEGYIVQVFPMR